MLAELWRWWKTKLYFTNLQTGSWHRLSVKSPSWTLMNDSYVLTWSESSGSFIAAVCEPVVAQNKQHTWHLAGLRWAGRLKTTNAGQMFFISSVTFCVLPGEGALLDPLLLLLLPLSVLLHSDLPHPSDQREIVDGDVQLPLRTHLCCWGGGRDQGYYLNISVFKFKQLYPERFSVKT